MTFLDVAAGYFRRLEYVTKQEIPYSILPTLASIAQEFVQKVPLMEDIIPTEEVESLHSVDVNLGPETGPHMQTMPGLDLAGNPLAPYHKQSDFGETLYQTNGNNALEPLNLAVEGTTYCKAGPQSIQENEIMDFFGTLLDGTNSFIYGTDFGQ